MTAAQILAMDIGSTAVKAGLFDADGLACSEVTSVRHRQEGVDPPGHLRPNELLDAAVRAVRSLDLSSVKIVAASTIWHAVVAVDEDGQPIGPALSWEAAAPVGMQQELAARLGRTWTHELSGGYLHPSYSLVSMPLLVERSPHRVIDLGSWVVGRLAGSTAAWPENLAAASGLWMQHDRGWNRPALDRLGLDQNLIGASWSQPVPAQSPLIAELRGAMFLPPVGDGLCHNLGQHAIDGRVAITVGTSGSVRSVSTGAPFGGPGHGLWRYRCADTTVATGGAITSAGNTFEWVARLFGAPIPWQDLTAASVHRLPDADSSIFGRRGPDYPWNASGSLSGITPDTEVGDIALAWGLDVWQRVRDHLVALRSLHGVERELLVEGGAVDANPAAVQVLSDVIGAPVTRTTQSQPSLAGAALLGASARRTGRFDIDATVHMIRTGRYRAPRGATTYTPRREISRALQARWRRSEPVVC